MITLKIKAALGNQLFQYAYARAISLRAKAELVIDTSWYSSIPSKDTPRIFLLDKYNINAAIKNTGATDTQNKSKFSSIASLSSLAHKIYSKINRTLFKYSDYVFYPKLNTRPDGSIVEGFWNTELYFKEFADTIRKELTLKNPLGEKALAKEGHLKQMIQDGRILVLIHVRRGDYVTNAHAASFHGAKGTEYYNDAIQRLRDELGLLGLIDTNKIDAGKISAQQNTPQSTTKITFILSSDDIEWVKESIVPLLQNVPNANYEILSDMPNIKDYEEIYLMSLCHHFIIANSSYSWWPAWLSTTATKQGLQKIVVGPKKWTNDPNVNTKDVLPTDWIRI